MSFETPQIPNIFFEGRKRKRIEFLGYAGKVSVKLTLSGTGKDHYHRQQPCRNPGVCPMFLVETRAPEIHQVCSPTRSVLEVSKVRQMSSQLLRPTPQMKNPRFLIKIKCTQNSRY